MDLDEQIYPLLRTVDWFARCGTESSLAIPLPYDWVQEGSIAIASALGERWLDARTEAQGDLTGFLAGRDYDAYGHWNELAITSRKRLQQDVMPQVNSALARIDAEVLSDSVRLDLNRFALFAAYSKRFGGIPDFFATLFRVYEAGYLPCGWNGDLDKWPSGRLLIY